MKKQNHEPTSNSSNDKPWYEKLYILFGIIVSVFAILGISIFGNISFHDFIEKFQHKKDEPVAEEQTNETELSTEETIYNNSVTLELVCASVFAKNIKNEYVPVAYSNIPITDEMQCILLNDHWRYSFEIKDNLFYVSNIVPGQYTVFFVADGYMFDEFEIDVTEYSEVVSNIKTKYMEYDYADYTISYPNYKNTKYQFVDCTYKLKTSEDVFETNETGTLNFQVIWNLAPHVVHIRTDAGIGLSIDIDKKFDNGQFLNY